MLSPWQELVCASGVLDRQVHVWNLETGEDVITLSGHRGVVQCLAVQETSGHLISLDAMGDMKLWDLSSFTLLQTIPHADVPNGEQISVLCFNEDDERLITASRTLLKWRSARSVATADQKASRALCPTGHQPRRRFPRWLLDLSARLEFRCAELPVTRAWVSAKCFVVACVLAFHMVAN